MKWFSPKTLFDKVFEYGIILKGIDGLIEFIAGLVLFFITPDKIHNLIVLATHQELVKDPHDFIANILLQSSHSFDNGGRIFLIVYLWIHAAIKLIAVIGILRNQMWAYPFSLISLSILTVYQLYEIIFVKPSPFMVLLTVFDIFIIWLIWREYSKIRAKVIKLKTVH